MQEVKEQNILKLLWFVYKRYYHHTRFAKYIWVYVVLRFFVNLYPLLISYFLARVIDISINAINAGKGFEEVIPTLAIFFVVSVIWLIVNNIYQYIDSVIDLWIPYLDDNVYLNKYAEIEPQAYEDPKFVNSKSMLGWNTWVVVHSFFEALHSLSAIPVLIISFLAIFNQLPLLAVLALFASIPAALITKRFGKKLWNIWAAKGEEKIIYSNYREVLWGTNFERLQEVFIFKYGRYLIEKARKYNIAFNKKLQKNHIERYTWTTLLSFLSNVVNIFVMVYSLQMVFKGELSIGMLTFVISAYQKFYMDIDQSLQRVSTILGNKNALNVFYNVLNWANKIKSGNQQLDNVSTGLELEFRNVWFKYPDTEKWILQDVSFKVDKDEDIALVGKNGAGKSTIIKLLLRIYDPQKGDIYINGKNLKDVDLDSYYKHIGILSQSFNKLAITVEDNIYIGDITKKKGKNVRDAAISADIDSTIAELPLKYKTFLSREIKDGIQLSGGQWQKLAIARAFFRDAKLLVLDEPTSAVDSISEEKIFDNIKENSTEKTTLIVSHRFATVRKAGRILVLNDGKIVEDGSHSQLMGQNGLYSQMYNKQVGVT